MSKQQAESKDVDDDNTSNASMPEKGKKRRGKTTKGGNFDKDEDAQEVVPVKGKKNQRKNKDVGSTGGKKGSDKVKEENSNVPVEWVVEKITSFTPELEEMGGEKEIILFYLKAFHARSSFVPC
jgi:E3 UFM1-protein ligase 1